VNAPASDRGAPRDVADAAVADFLGGFLARCEAEDVARKAAYDADLDRLYGEET
jgi:hypothetical protein